ncbi:ketopantoate reductase family protein [Streptomyces ziwulingensis]|uniref:Ketopantoate reductase family protein n=1 Tax=Streptomyces ziwulingensis TaxID=1045501 RepID=A0ABP9B9T5_9ACTN
MRYIVIGAGAIGGSIGGRLFENGHDVVLVARGAHLQALRADGLRFTTPEGTRHLSVPLADGPDAVGLRPDDVLVLAVKTQHSAAALEAWTGRPVADGSTAGASLPVLCAQNGVENERQALRRFRRVHGVCVVLPAAFLRPGAVTAKCGPYTGTLILGPYPSPLPLGGGVPAGEDELLRRIAADLEDSKFLAPVVPDVMRWKYGKLLSNLIQTVEALCGPVHDDTAVTALVERAGAEGVAVLRAAGIDHADPTEMAQLRQGKVEPQPVPDGEWSLGSAWQSLTRRTGSVEADYINGEIVLLGRLHGVPTPVNETLLRAVHSCAENRRPPGGSSASGLLELAGHLP